MEKKDFWIKIAVAAAGTTLAAVILYKLLQSGGSAKASIAQDPLKDIID